MSQNESYIEQLNQPLNGKERVIFITALIFVLLGFILSIPVYLTVFITLYIAKKDQEPELFEKAAKLMKLEFVIIVLAVFLSTLIHSIVDGSDDSILFIVELFGAIMVTVYWWIIHKYIFQILIRHRIWIINNGLFADKN